MKKLLTELRELNIKIKFIDGDIKIIALNGKLSDEIINKLKNEKENLIKYFNISKKVRNRVLTPSDFTYKKLSIDEVDKLSLRYDIEDIYQLTPMQEGMLFHSIHDPDSSAYFEQMSYSLQSNLSVELMQSSLDELFQRHEILRTIFIYKDVETPLQVVLKNRECGFIYEDIRRLSKEEKELYVADFKKRDIGNGFLLDQNVLMRVALLQFGDNDYELIWSHHHILMDGWCISIINNDFFEIYNSLLNNRDVNLYQVTHYKEYIKWLDQIDKNISLKYWKEYLSGYEEQATLPCLIMQGNGFVQQSESLQFSKELSTKFQKIASENNVTANIILQSVWAIVLGKYSNKEDIVFGSVVSGRPSEIAGIETIVGLFINNVPVRIQYSQDFKFSTLIKKVQNSNIDSESHHYISLAEIQSQSLLRQNLIDHIIVFENYPIAEKIEGLNEENEYQELKLEITDVDIIEQTNYNLMISASLKDRLSVKFVYNSNVYDSGMMAKLKVHFENIIIGIVHDPSVKISAIDILTEEEKQQLLYEFNDTKLSYPRNKTIHQLFEEQVAINSEIIALTINGKTLTYSQLNEKANRLAWKLREQGVKNDTIVGLLVERSLEMVVGILGIIKAGGAYLPIDIKYPQERIKYMLEDSKLQLLLVNTEISSLNPAKVQYRIYDLRDESSYNSNKSNLKSINTPEDLIYIIYTSGSTGKPKGVMIEHRNMVNLINFNYEKTNIDFSSILQFSTICFDASAHEIFGALLSGGKLVLVDETIRLNITELFKLMSLNGVKTVFWPMSFIKMIFGEESYVKELPSCLRHIQTAGEQVVISERLRKYLKEQNVFLHNHYGPSETHVVTTLTLTPNDDHPELPSIGKPISNTSAYILDKALKPVPIGVIGELYFGGVQVGRGYLGKEDLTREKFIESPFIEGEKIYQTGDIAKWTNDGNIKFLGRVDFQVKIRGFRVEFGEIENILQKHEKIIESVVIAREENGDKYLCAYVVCDGELNQEELRNYLEDFLPDYMVPSYFVKLECLPLTSNEKINRNVLPLPEVKDGFDYVAPSNEIEERLVKIWSEVLNVTQEEISVSANFFALGGHSLKATILVSKILKEFGITLPLNVVFKSPTVSRLSDYIENAVKENYYTIEPAEEKDYYVLSSAQKRLYFLQEMDLKSSSYNIPLVLNLNKSIEKDILESTLKNLINRHEALRTSFERINGIPVQKIHHVVDFKLDYYEVSEAEVSKIVKNYIRPFDLSKVPLVRSALLKLPAKKYIWIVDMHHIISDGTSHSVLTEDFISLYFDIKLPKLKLQYKDFSEWQNFLLESGKIEKQKKYWLDLYSEEIPKLNLPTDYNRPEVFTYEGDSYVFQLDREDYAKLKKLSSKFDGTLYMNILALLNVLFYKYTGQTDIIIGSGVAGRGHIDLQHTIGMFVNSLAMRNFPLGNKTYKEFLQEVITKSVLAFENQDVQFEDLIDKLCIKRDPSRNPLFDICMVVQNYRKFGEGKHEEKIMNVNGLSLEEGSLISSFRNNTAKFDMTIFVNELEDDLFINIEYYTGIFKKETIIEFSNHFLDIVKQVVNNNEIIIDDIILSRKLEDTVFKENNIGFNL